jgi:hypothetical protein
MLQEKAEMNRIRGIDVQDRSFLGELAESLKMEIKLRFLS